MTDQELRAELNPYDPPSTTPAFVWAAIIGVLSVAIIVLSVLYGAGVFD